MLAQVLQKYAQNLLYLSPSMEHEPLAILSSPVCDMISQSRFRRPPYLGRRLLQIHLNMGTHTDPLQMVAELKMVARHCALPSASSPHSDKLRAIIGRTGENDDHTIDALIAAGIWHKSPERVMHDYLKDRFAGSHFQYLSKVFHAECVIARSKIVKQGYKF